ncbi:hypothetical protein, partial [Bifidobacterium jacchi]|uniref:hypothetical protein n=1 Tax=Bifidobacterium jacchi TaxID=2490545 RepID=UPI0019D52476
SFASTWRLVGSASCVVEDSTYLSYAFFFHALESHASFASMWRLVGSASCVVENSTYLSYAFVL